MSNSVSVAIINTGWTEISQGVSYGFFTNFTDHYIVYKLSAVQPNSADQTGHRLNPGASQGYALPPGQAVWARGVQALQNTYTVIVTPGYDTFSGRASKHFYTEVNAGKVEGVTLVHKFGWIGAANTTPQHIWAAGGSMTFLQAAATHELVSSNVADAPAGLGARSVFIIGLLADFTEASEVVNLNGIIPVQTVNQYIRIRRAYVLDCGVYGGSNLGNITIRVSPAGVTQGYIVADIGQTQKSQDCIPAGKTGYIIRVSMTAETNKQTYVKIWRRSDAHIVTAPFRGRRLVHRWDGVTAIEENFPANHRMPEKTDVWFEVSTAPATTSIVQVDYDMILIDNG